MTAPDAIQPPSMVPAAMPMPRPRKHGRVGNILLGLAAVVAIGGLAFAGGRATAPTSSGFAAGQGGLPQAPTGSFTPGGGLGGPMTMSGTVSGVDGSTLTMTTASGQTVTVDLAGTTYHAQAAGSASEVTAGDTVQVTVSGRPGAAAGASASPGTASTTLAATDVTITSN